MGEMLIGLFFLFESTLEKNAQSLILRNKIRNVELFGKGLDALLPNDSQCY